MAGDLHCHTKFSDGTVGIEDLIALAKASGLSAVAVTDHDTMAGAHRACVVGKRQGIRVIPGVELSAFDYKRARKVHLLCYLADAPDRLEGLCRKTKECRKRAGQLMAQEVMKKYPVPAQMILAHASGSSNIYKQHIMHALMDCGFTTAIFGPLFEQLFGKTGSCTVEKEYPDVFEVLRLIQEAGGIGVLAHPELYDSFDVMQELASLGLDGVEVWHPRQSAEGSKRAEAFALSHGLLMTGGSDFHGMYNAVSTPLGTAVTPDEQLERLLAYKQSKRSSGV